MRVLTVAFSLIGLLLAGTAAQAEWRGFATTDVNMRSGPGTGYAVIDLVPEGARVFVDSCGGDWCDVTYRGEEGFVSRRYLEQTRVRDYAPQAEIYVTPGYEQTPYYDDPPNYDNNRRVRRENRRIRRQLRREQRRRAERQTRRQRRSQDRVFVEREPRRNRIVREQRKGQANRNRNRNNVTRDSRRERNARAAERRNNTARRRAVEAEPRVIERPTVSGCPNNMICDVNGRVIGFGGK